MPRRMVFSMITLISGFIFTANLGAQNASPKGATDAVTQEKWNNVPPRKSAYAGKKSGPAPRRDISGIWDAAELDGGRQPSGALEHPALTAPRGQGVEGGRPDETGIMRPLHYTPMGLAALKANKPSGPSVR